MNGTGQWTERGLSVVADADAVDLATRLTLVLLVLTVSTTDASLAWWLRAPLTILPIVGLLLPGLHRSRMLWLLLTLCYGLKTIGNWWTQDNHLFLFSYWILAIYLALASAQPALALRTSGRLLVGFVFLFAITWRGLLSPDFLDGTFFHYVLLSDTRFRELSSVVGGLSNAQIQHNIEALAQLTARTLPIQAVELQDTPALHVLATSMTAWAIAIEGTLCVAFLWPYASGPGRMRDALLILFAWTTYLIAPVAAFGWLLMTMGLVQCPPERRALRLLYLITCPLLFVFGYLPILSLFSR